MAAATVPEYSTSSPRLGPSLMPETTMSILEVEEPGDREVHAVGGRAGHEVHARLGFEHAQRHVERQRVAGAAAVAVRRDDGDLAERRQRLAQAPDAFGTVAVVVADQNLHNRAGKDSPEKGRAIY